MAISAYFRLACAGWVLLREGITRLVNPDMVPASAKPLLGFARLFEKRSVRKADNAERLTEALNRLGPTYIKMGQFLATRPDIVGADVARDLAKLQDNLPPFVTDIAKSEIEAALGAPVDELFTSFSEPVAAASIAQVHKATMLDANGEEKTVAVKVLRPGISQRFANDLESFKKAGEWAEFLIKDARRLRPVAAIETHSRSAELELDLRLEAAALSELGENIADDPGIRTPNIVWRHVAKNVLVTEWVEGIKFSDPEAIAKSDVDKEKLARTIIQSFLNQAVRDGFFHADMHQGNLFLEPDGTLCLVDGGIMGRINQAESQFLAEILWGFVKRDYMRIAEVHFDAGYVPARHKVEDFAQALRAIGEPIHGEAAENISMARLLQQLLEVTDLFDMPLQPQLIFLQRTMVVAEGVARGLDPNFNMWDAAEPVLSEWMKRELGPAAHLTRLANSANTLGKLAGELPVMADRARALSDEMDRMTKDGIRLDEKTIKAIGKAEGGANRATTYSLVAIALSLVTLTLTMLFG